MKFGKFKEALEFFILKWPMFTIARQQRGQATNASPPSTCSIGHLKGCSAVFFKKLVTAMKTPLKSEVFTLHGMLLLLTRP